MEQDAIRTLKPADQITFLRGRILEAALSMEAVTRYLHVRLGGRSELEAALDTPQQFTNLITDCKERALRCEQLTDRTRPLTLGAITSAASLYERRNRFVHDFLRKSLTSEQRWERAKLSRPKREIGKPLPEPEPVSAEDMVDLILDLIGTTWRLRGALWSLIGPSGEISPYLTHSFEPQWDGSFLPSNDASSPSVRESQR